MKALPLSIVAVVAFALGVLGDRLVVSPRDGPERDRAEKAEARAKALEEQVARLTTGGADAAGPARDGALAAGGTHAAPPPPAVPEPPPMAEPEPSMESPPPKAATAPRFLVPGYEEALQGVDWPSVGSSLHGMAPLIAQFAEEWAKTGKMPLQLAGRIQQLNGPLLTAALAIVEKMKLEPQEANSAFTHPAFMVNAIASALDDAKLPLTEAQSAALDRLAAQYVQEDQRRQAARDDRTWALQKLIDDSDLRQRFFDAAFAQLTPEQNAALEPPGVKGRLQADLFSAALLWLPHCRALPFTDRDALVADAERDVLTRLALGEARREAVHGAVVEWADRLPPEWTSTPADAMSLNGMVPVSRVLESARREIVLLQRVIDAARMDEEAAAKVRAVDVALVPLRSAPPR